MSGTDTVDPESALKATEVMASLTFSTSLMSLEPRWRKAETELSTKVHSQGAGHLMKPTWSHPTSGGLL